MRFLADENFPGAAVAALTAAGHDIVWVRTAMPGAADADVLARAARDQRILRCGAAGCMRCPLATDQAASGT